MKCPACKEVTLVISERQDIEIDYCPECRGVWLDRGELDKIIERSSPTSVPPQSHRSYKQYNESKEQHDHRNYRDDDYYDNRKRKKRGFLGELFDFD